MPAASSLRAVALFEAAKGLLALAAGSGVLLLLHHDVRAMALQLVEHAHLNPAAHYPHLFLDAVARVQDMRLWLLVAGVLAYAGIRFAEAWGLWRGRAWAEVLAALSGGIYLPLEVTEAVHRPGGLSAVLLLLNLAVVLLMLRKLWGRRER